MSPGDVRRLPTGAVIFDLDGVLVDSEPLLLEAERLAVAAYGAVLTPEIKAPLIGLGGREVLQALVARLDLDVEVDTLGAQKMAHYLALVEQVAGFEPTTALVRALQARQVPMAIASGSAPEAIDAAVAAIGLRDAFPVRVSTSEVAQGKPAPDVFLLAAQRLGVEPARCVVVEDSLPGLRAAHAAGMACLVIPSVPAPRDPGFSAADLLVSGGMADADALEMLGWVLGASEHG